MDIEQRLLQTNKAIVMDIKPKEATEIINSLLSGTVPRIGIQHIAVGRDDEIQAIIRTLNDVKDGHNAFKFWIGEFGSGKSFMLHLMKVVALKQKFVVSQADFSPETRLYSTDGKSLALYRNLMDNISIQTKPDGGALPTLIERWIDQVVLKTAEEHNLTIKEIRNPLYDSLIEQNLLKVINNFTEADSFDFSLVIKRYYDGYVTNDDELKRNALRWLKGEYKNRTAARIDLGVRDIIDDRNWYNMVKNLCRLFVSIGYSGFLLNLDEAINLYKIPNTQVREKNYEKILTIYNDCYQGNCRNLFVNFAGTNEFLENRRRGLYSYEALKSRIEPNKYAVCGIKDFAQPVIKIEPIDNISIFILLKNLKSVFDFHYDTQMVVSDENIRSYMEDMYRKPGASEFLMPREIIRDFLNILSVLRQNPTLSFRNLCKSIEIKDERPSIDTLLDSIEKI